MAISPDDLDICIEVLQKIAAEPELMSQDYRLKPLLVKIQRKQRRLNRKRHKQSDQQLQAKTQLVQQRSLQQIDDSFPTLKSASPESRSEPQSQPARLRSLQKCYVCKQSYRQLNSFYHLLCPACATINEQKRHQWTNLSGRTALITGGRIKIGYQTALKLLRDGARVLVTTRFPYDCAHRYSQEADLSEWCDRLQIHSLDLRNLPVLEAWIQQLLRSEPALDILINNAAQTIKPSPNFYQSLCEREQQLQSQLTPAAQALLAAPVSPPQTTQLIFPPDPPNHSLRSGALFDNAQRAIQSIQQTLDQDGQPLDLQSVNSWQLKLEQIGSLELLEVQLVNAIAPFVLNSQLKPLMMRSSFPQRFIINVAAKEGQFSGQGKTAYHPHTNMAKAALNMMTRTSAEGYARDGIFMNSVDPGWMSDQNPHPKKTRLQQEYGFYPPLDAIDSAARIYDPIVQGIEQPDDPMYGYLLKDYLPCPW